MATLKGQMALDFVEKNGGWLRVEDKGFVDLATAKRAPLSKVTGGARKAKAAGKGKASKPAKSDKPRKSGKGKGAKSSTSKAGIVSEIKRLVKKL